MRRKQVFVFNSLPCCYKKFIASQKNKILKMVCKLVLFKVILPVLFASTSASHNKFLNRNTAGDRPPTVSSADVKLQSSLSHLPYTQDAWPFALACEGFAA